MHWWNKATVALLLGLATGWAQTADDAQTMKGFRVPSYDAEGNLTSQMFGDFARILPDGMVEITELRMEFYEKSSTNQATEMRVSSPRCLYHRLKGTAESDDTIRIARDNMVVTGRGYSWNNTDEVMKIRNDAKVVLKDARRQMDEGEQR
jgi:hypothetical protein